MQIALACPTCRYPLGSGGKRVCTRPLYLLVFRSSIKRSRMKLEGRGSGAALSAVSGSVFDVFIILDLTATGNERGFGSGWLMASSLHSGRYDLTWRSDRH